MQLTKIEQQLVALALNLAAHPGEVANAAAAFFRSLRKRNVAPAELDSNSDLAAKLKDKVTELERTIESQSAQISKLKTESFGHSNGGAKTKRDRSAASGYTWDIAHLESTIMRQKLHISQLKAQSSDKLRERVKCLEEQLKFLQDTLVATPFGGCPTCKQTPQKTWRDKFREA